MGKKPPINTKYHLYEVIANQNPWIKEIKLTEPIRLSPEEVRKKVTEGHALLVCAYDSPNKFRLNHLENAISLGEFKSKLSSITYDQEIIFYCN